MGGAFLTIRAPTKEEVEMGLLRLEREAVDKGLTDNRGQLVVWIEEDQEWEGTVWMHS